MFNYLVKCQSAAGHTREIPVSARTDEQACSAALASLPKDYRAVWALRED